MPKKTLQEIFKERDEERQKHPVMDNVPQDIREQFIIKCANRCVRREIKRGEKGFHSLLLKAISTKDEFLKGVVRADVLLSVSESTKKACFSALRSDPFPNPKDMQSASLCVNIVHLSTSPKPLGDDSISDLVNKSLKHANLCGVNDEMAWQRSLLHSLTKKLQK